MDEKLRLIIIEGLRMRESERIVAFEYCQVWECVCVNMCERERKRDSEKISSLKRTCVIFRRESAWECERKCEEKWHRQMIWLILEQWLEGKIDDDVNKEKFFFFLMTILEKLEPTFEHKAEKKIFSTNKHWQGSAASRTVWAILAATWTMGRFPL